MAVVLVISRADQPDLKEEYQVAGKMVIGHSTYCDIKLNDKLVSNLQCQVQQIKSGQVIITNLDMKKAVYLNKTKLKRASLKVNDVLEIGPFVVRIDPEKLSNEEIELINAEFIEYC